MKQDGVSLKVNISMPEGLDQLPELLRPLLNQVRETTKLARSKGTLIQCMIAIHNSFDTHAVLPVAGGPGFESDKTKPGLLSWRVHLLPQLGSYSLYKQFHLDEPWDSKHNSQFIKKMPKVLGDDPSGKTTFHMFIGKGTPFGGKLGIKLRDVTDGHSNVIGVVEAGPDKAEIWTKPGGLPFDPKNPIAALGNIGDKFIAAFLDGRVHELPRTIDAETLSKLIQHADGASVEIP
jgi:hypothetical protein